jgi:N-methylhydantoinase B
MRNIDTVTLELIQGAIRSARAEMEALIDRTAMSPFIREKKDYFTAFFDKEGRLVSSTALPMAGNLIDCVFEHYPAETMKPGDLYWYNDPYGSKGAVSHMPDMVFVAPVFAANGEAPKLIGFAEAWGHLWDIGGMVPGSISPDATDCFQEGVLMPPARIEREGLRNEELFRAFLRNTRFPEMVRGDVSAIMAAVRMGKRRLEEIAERFGSDALEAAFETALARSEATLKQALTQRLPEGSWRFRDWIDSDAVSDRSYGVDLKLTRKGDDITLDFTQTDDQAAGAINFIMDESVPKFMAGLMLAMDDPSVGMTAGFTRAMGEVKTRPGSLVDPRQPAPLGMRSHTMLRVTTCMSAVLAQATGGQAQAASSVYVIYYLRSFDRARGALELCIEGLAVGFGARPHADGIDAVYYVAQKNYPVEFAEMEFGVRVERYGLHVDSGGPGRFRGGAGIVRDIRVIADEAVIGLRMDNVRHPTWGVNGGQGGRSGRILINPGTPEEREVKPLSDQNKLKKGDLVRIMTSGGGGWGSPLDRPAEQVLADVQDGFISEASARDDYGVVLTGDGLAVDPAATEAARQRLTRPTKMFHRAGEYFDAPAA